jgi:mono/diheme cytochrome c family protein
MPGERFRLLRAGGTAFISIAALLLPGCQVRTPGTFEAKFMQGAKRRITVGGRSDVNPFPASDENIAAGQRTFTSYCMVCHGLDGQNTGVPFAEKMSPPVPPLSSPSVQAYSDGQLHWIIQHGISPSGMPASRDVFHDEEIWQLVLYIRHLPPKGSLGEPQVYGGEPKLPPKSVARKPGTATR